MKILYDSISTEYTYPLSKKDMARIRKHIPSEVLPKILQIRFGCSRRSPREGRMQRRGASYDIRVNFCVRQAERHLESLLLSTRKRYLEDVERYGGKPDITKRTIIWDLKSAKRYACYVLLHEIGHIVYFESGLPHSDSERSTTAEEKWCDNYAARAVERIEI